MPKTIVMEQDTGRNSFAARFSAPLGAEKDMVFRATVLRMTRTSMVAVGLLGLLAPLIYVGTQVLLTGATIRWSYEQLAGSTGLVVLDKLLIMLLGAASLVLSRTHSGPRWGRLIVALILIVAAVATLTDDILQSNVSLSVAWLALLMFVSLTVPFRAWHTMLVSASILAVFILYVPYLPPILGWEPVAIRMEHLIFLVLVALACSGISGLLYGSLYRQHQSRLVLAATNRKLRDTQAQLVQSAKMASLGNLVAGIAHEINNPLGVIHSNASLAKVAADRASSALDTGSVANGKYLPEDICKSLRVLSEINAATLEASTRINIVVKALRSFARLDEAEVKQVDLHEGIESVLTVLPQAPDKNISIVRDFGELPPIECHPGQINQVVMNLLLNAVESIDNEGTITITTGAEDNWAVIKVADTGRGIPQEEQQKVFDPGYTTKGVGVGTGLGLSICYRVVESHNGKIDLSSTAGEGTAVTVRLPVQA